jgi:hydrogenase maturation protein HypF
MNCPETSAVGRLFDAAAAIIGNMNYTSFEAEGPMLLESLCVSRAEPVELPLEQGADGIWRSNWEPLLDIINDERRGQALRAESFHSSMAHAVLRQARQVRREHNVDRVGLCGGVFQNRVLTEHAVDLLTNAGFSVRLPGSLPGNDAALSFGQAAELAARHNKR